MEMNCNILFGARRVFKISVSRCNSRLWFSSVFLLNITSFDSCNPVTLPGGFTCLVFECWFAF